MRINKFVAAATGISRRQADKLIQGCRVFINERQAQLSDHVTTNDSVTVNKQRVFLPLTLTTILLHKPPGYVCSRNGQGSRTVYDLLPPDLHQLKTIGRLDKDSSGLIVMTDNGDLAHELTHPSFEKKKLYNLELNRPLEERDFQKITEAGVDIGDGKPSRFDLAASGGKEKDANCFLPSTFYWQAELSEGRNRQIRRTFSKLGYTVRKLHRIQFGAYLLGNLNPGEYKKAS